MCYNNHALKKELKKEMCAEMKQKKEPKSKIIKHYSGLGFTFAFLLG
jgi:hypothetical protein